MSADRVGYHRTYRLSADNTLIEETPSSFPRKGTIARELAQLSARQLALNEKLTAPGVQASLAASPSQAGIYPLRVTRFTASCEGDDADGAAESLTQRLGNLRIIRVVPFMRKGNIVFAIRSQGLVDPATGQVESVDALFQGGIYWRGTLDDKAFNYELLMFRQGKDQFVGRMTESIDLTRKVGDIDPALFQAEVGYHFEHESNDANGKPTLSRQLQHYGSTESLQRVAACYGAAAAFGHAAQRQEGNLRELALTAQSACSLVPGKRYYQAYDAFLQGILYDPGSLPCACDAGTPPDQK